MKAILSLLIGGILLVWHFPIFAQGHDPATLWETQGQSQQGATVWTPGQQPTRITTDPQAGLDGGIMTVSEIHMLKRLSDFAFFTIK